MEITSEGHIRVSPTEICERLTDPPRLINDILIPGTPAAFPTHTGYCDFLACCANALEREDQSIARRRLLRIAKTD